MHNLIPNGSFESGLSEWEATPSGVTLIKTDTKRFVMLQAGTRSAAICSDPVKVLPGAAYIVEIERALRGHCEIAAITPNGLLIPDGHGEIIPIEDKVRVQVTARPGEKVGIAKVLLVPVGERLALEGVRSTAGFRKTGDPFEILCEVKNTGSQTVPGAMIRLVSNEHQLQEEHRAEQPISALKVGERRTMSWPVAKQKSAYADFAIELEYGGEVEKATGATLRHLPRPPEVRPTSSVVTGRRWFSVGSRALRMTSHETDLDYGPALLTTEIGLELGVLPTLAQLVLPNGSVLPLWSKLKSSTAAGVELAGKNEYLDWTIVVRSDTASRGVGIDLRFLGKRRIPNAVLELLPFQTVTELRDIGGALLLPGKGELRLRWVSKQANLSFFVDEASGMAALRTPKFTLMPSPLRLSAWIAPADRGLVRS
jgi:hypothetical protein